MDNGKPDEFSAKIISLGRITIPEEMRLLHNLVDGDVVTVKIVAVNKVAKVSDKEAS